MTLTSSCLPNNVVCRFAQLEGASESLRGKFSVNLIVYAIQRTSGIPGMIACKGSLWFTGRILFYLLIRFFTILESEKMVTTWPTND